MRWLLWINTIAIVIYASFVAAILVADVWIFPKMSALNPPPEQVAVAIRQGSDIEGLRELALVLYDHVSEQAKTVNGLVKGMVFWARAHFLFALGLATFNVVMLVRLRRAVTNTGENAAKRG